MDVKIFKQGEGPVNTLGIHVCICLFDVVDIVIYVCI
jgi:hypothetical protein